MRTRSIILVILFVTAPGLAPAESGGGALYSPIGKRDPFRKPEISEESRGVATLPPRQRFSVDKFILKAVLRGRRPQAMLQDPTGQIHIVGEGDVLGREKATVSRILNREVIVTERTVNYLGRETLFERVLSLPEEKQFGQNDIGERVPVNASRSVSGAPAAPVTPSKGQVPAGEETP